MRQLKSVLLSLLTTAVCVSAYQTARSLPITLPITLPIDVTADLPTFTEQLSSEQQYAYCPPGVGCDTGGSR